MNSKQFEFDAVVAHLYKQGRPAKDDYNRCYYRGENGLTCAFGCRIPDVNYSPDMEQLNVCSALDVAVGTLPPELYEYRYMYMGLQGAHDNCNTNEDGTFDLVDLANRLRDTASHHKVTFTEPKGE